MKRRKNNIGYTILLLLILVIGIGYAYLTSNLSITGATSVAGNTWDIHFDNLNITNGSVTATTPATINPSDNTKINYTVLLNRPGDYYEFSVDMVNSGTLPGKITLVELSGITADVEDVIDYSVVYTNSTKPVAVADILNSGATKNIKVRIYYKEDIEEEELLASNVDLTITFNIVFNQADKNEVTTNTIVQQLKTENSSCFTKYEGQVTDKVGETVTAENVYFNKCEDKRNIIFNNMCWQMIRTTETGGIKMIYNGEPVNGKCESTREDHKGIVQANYSTETLNEEYLYGNKFSYDINSNKFTILDTKTGTFSYTNYEDFIGLFTCKSNGDTCTTLYKLDYYDSRFGLVHASSYTIANINYSEIGKSSFNSAEPSPATAGYMYNKNYLSLSKESNSLSGTFKFGSTFSYNSNNDNYSTFGTVVYTTPYWNSAYKVANKLHYTCWDSDGNCQTIAYVFYTQTEENGADIDRAGYIFLKRGKNITEALNEMLWDEDVNKKNSSIKDIIDNWYTQNITNKTDLLEDVVYCNARDATTIGGWDPEADINNTGNHAIEFRANSVQNDLTCPNITDQLSISNTKAKLTYPVGLIRYEEWSNHPNNLLATGDDYWTSSPHNFLNIYSANIKVVSSEGASSIDNASSIKGVRPVISLASFASFSSGTGSETDPWIIKE